MPASPTASHGRPNGSAVPFVPIASASAAPSHAKRVQSPDGAIRNVTFFRNRLNAPQPITARLAATTDGSRIGYIFIPTFFDRTIPDQVRQALQNFGQLDGLILDWPYKLAMVGLVSGILGLFAGLFGGMDRYGPRALASLILPALVLAGFIWEHTMEAEHPPVHEVATDWQDPATLQALSRVATKVTLNDGESRALPLRTTVRR